MTVTPLRGGRDSAVFVLLTPVLLLLSVCLERADPRVPGKFSFLVLLVPTLLVALTGKRWQGLVTALIAGVGCIAAGWAGTAMESASGSLTAMSMPVLLGGALLSIGSLLTLRCDDAQQRIGKLGEAVERIVAAENLESLVQTILDAVDAVVPTRVCELHVWDPREQAFVRLRMAFQTGTSGKLAVWNSGAQQFVPARLESVVQPIHSVPLFGGSLKEGSALAPTLEDWQAIERELGKPDRNEYRVPLTSGDGEVFGFLRFRTEGRLPPEFGHVVHILAGSAGLAMKNVRLFERLRDQAQRDGLTGLMNHAAFHSALNRSLDEAAETASPLALVLLDLDKFKHVNDRYGHQVGDRMLQTLSELWRQIVPPDAVLARYGGDEFACILPNHDVASVREHLTRLKRSLADSPIDTGNDELSIEPSIGVALYPTDAQGPEELFREADQALYAAKRNGGGFVYLADAESGPRQRASSNSNANPLAAAKHSSRSEKQGLTAPVSRR